MKLKILSFLALLAATEAQFSGSADSKREACEDCLEDLEEAYDCLRECNEVAYDPDGDGPILASLDTTGSVLNFCLASSDESIEGASVDSIDELVECCNMSEDCEDELEDAQECLEECFDPCLRDTAEAYLDCIQDENRGVDSSKCSRQECLNGFLDDLEDSIESFEDFDNSEDLLSLDYLEDRLEEISEGDLQECGLLDEFVDAICDIGDDCCERCNPELAIALDCLVNDIVIPFVSIELNTTIEICPITEDCELEGFSRSRKAKRGLSQQEENLFDRALSLPKTSSRQTKRNRNKEAAIKKADQRRAEEGQTIPADEVDKCSNKMNMDVITHNITFASNKFVECLTAAAIAALPEENESSSALVKFGFSAAAAMMASFVALM